MRWVEAETEHAAIARLLAKHGVARAKENCDVVPIDFPGKGLWCKACWCAALFT